MSESFKQLFEESLQHQKSFSTGAIVTATVVGLTPDFVILHAGLKSEGIVAIDQFKDEFGQISLQVGDKVDVAIESLEDGFGETLLSRDRAKRYEAWNRLLKVHETQETITGQIVGKVRGGFTVEIDGIRAFLPGSLIDVRPLRDTTYLETHPIDIKVVKIDQRRNNIVVSRRAVIEKEAGAERASIFDSMKEGSEMKGVVKNLTDYGAFVDLGGVDGLLHVTDMSWKRVKHPSEILNVGDEIEVKILKYDAEKQRVSLGMKQLADDPWLQVVSRCAVGQRVTGKVTTITDYGCFVEIENGIEGLIHMSEMDWTNKNVNPNKIVAIGDEVEVMVLEIDSDRRRVSLGLKQCKENPWQAFAAKFEKGTLVKGPIKSITDFGIFVGLEGDIDGLVHLSDLSWTKSGEEAVREYKKGQEVEALILTVDPEKERIALGIKQLSEDSLGQFSKNSIVKGTITEIEPKQVTVDLGEGVIGLIRVSDLSTEKVTDPNTVVNVGDLIEAKVMGVDRKTNQIQLSVKAKEVQDQKAALRELEGNPISATLGDLFKENMEKNG